MRFDDSSVDISGVNDRRGMGGGGALAVGGGGLGVVGLVLYLIVGALGGGDVSQLAVPSGTQVQGSGESAGELEQRCNTEGAIDRYNDCFLIKVYNEVNELWAEDLGGRYQQPGLVFFTQGTQTRCGPASSEVGPFYCPPDQTVFIDIGFLQALQDRFGAEGRYAQAYIMAHEVGHHLQTLFGTERQVRAAQEQRPALANRLSVAMELQADCYAGVWGRQADERGNVAITRAELDQALNAASAVGDDRIQKRTSGRVDPESWTHGSASQRRAWFARGFEAGTPDACDTFSEL